MLKAIHPPTKPEIRVSKVISDYNLPFKYVGNGDKWIEGLNPDFICTNEERKIIEVFGRYWHQEMDDISWKRTEEGRKSFFSELGYDTLILWDDQISNLSDQAIAKQISAFLMLESPRI